MMYIRFFKAVFMILAVGAITVNAKSSTSISGITKSNAQKARINTAKKVTELLKLYKESPKDALINNRLGYLYYSLGKYKNSEYHYLESVKYNPRNIEARLGLYLVSMANKDYNKAVKYCREIRSIDNMNYYGNLYYVYAKMAQYRYANAEQTCKKMLSAYPCDQTFLRLLKLNYTYQKKNKEAEQIQKSLNLLR